jgi:SAM-dependent methyltransferase
MIEIDPKSDTKARLAGFETNLYAELVKVEDQSFWFQGRNKIIVWFLRKYFPNIQNLLEIGCGTGFVLRGISKAFPKLALSGSELFVEGLQIAKERMPQADLFQLDALHIPFTETYDVIGAFDVLEHIEQDEQVLVEMYKAVRPGGGIILTVPQHMFLWSQSDEQAHHWRRYSRAELCSKVNRAGFKILSVTSFVSLILPLMVVSRLRQKLFRGEYNFISELKVGGVIGYLLEKTLALELLMIGVGVNFGAGGSLILVAQREE